MEEDVVKKEDSVQCREQRLRKRTRWRKKRARRIDAQVETEDVAGKQHKVQVAERIAVQGDFAFTLTVHRGT